MTISCSSGGSRCKAISKQEGVYHFVARIFSVAGADGDANFDAVAGVVARVVQTARCSTRSCSTYKGRVMSKLRCCSWV